MIDYEKIAEEVEGIPSPPAAPPFDLDTMFEDPVGPPIEGEEALAASERANREFLPVNHEKYQGIAAAKGYVQNDQRIKKTNYTHDAMIDVILAEPTISQKELAQRFDRSQVWISTIIGSDSFQAALAKRREDLTDPFLVATIEERFRGLADQSLQVIAESLEKTRNADLALKALDISAKALGFGARAPASAQGAVQNNFVIQLPPKMANSDEWAKAHSGPTIEG